MGDKKLEPACDIFVAFNIDRVFNVQGISLYQTREKQAQQPMTKGCCQAFIIGAISAEMRGRNRM